MSKNVHELKIQMRAIRKTQTEGILDMDNLRKRTNTASPTKHKKMEERISGIKDRIEEMNRYISHRKCQI